VISIAISTYNRPVQLAATLESIQRQNYKDLEIVVVDDGTDLETERICRGVRYFKLNRPQSSSYRDVGYVNNVAIRQTKGEIVILQNAECKHVGLDTIQKLVSCVNDTNVVFSTVFPLDQNGNKYGACDCPACDGKEPAYFTYTSNDRPRPYFFCGAMKRAWFEKLRGFDEDYPGGGYDDDDFAARLAKDGLKFEWSEAEVHHQWHPPAGRIDIEPARLMYERKCAEMEAGLIGTVRNLERDWGKI
jgi:GT2 family glycosyltransferase